LAWEEEQEGENLLGKITPGKEMHEYVALLNSRIQRIHEVMRIAQKEATDKRDGKLAEEINAYNERLDERLTKGLVDIPRDEEGRFKPDKRFIYPKGSYVLEKPAVKPSHKLGPRLEGPYLVLEHKFDTDTIVIRDLKTKKDRRISADRVTPFDDTEFTEKEMIELAQLDTQEYLVEEILSHERTSTGRMKEVDRYEFEVKWVGYKETLCEGHTITNENIQRCVESEKGKIKEEKESAL
ncbi:hypothetical protein ADUPG1_002015, partial [Aduncisulcus paluster]